MPQQTQLKKVRRNSRLQFLTAAWAVKNDRSEKFKVSKLHPSRLYVRCAGRLGGDALVIYRCDSFLQRLYTIH